MKKKIGVKALLDANIICNMIANIYVYLDVGSIEVLSIFDLESKFFWFQINVIAIRVTIFEYICYYITYYISV